MNRTTSTVPDGFTTYSGWQEVLAEAHATGVLYYWGAMMLRPQRVRVVRLFKNGSIRVDPMSTSMGVPRAYQADPFTLRESHFTAGCVFRRL
jgi:hypothetical protein